jgi:predicted unusual protein kinase regulating ubiquinone biosynthesis (AarF/ABC1/UbiB family)
MSAVGGSIAVVARRLRRSPAERIRLKRRATVVRLTVRNGARIVSAKALGRVAGEQRRAALEARATIRTAEDVANQLGHMKGALMKAGQLVSFIVEALPEEAQQALATLQADAPPMAPSLAAEVVREELGGDPERIFLDWSPEPVAAASIGQVHRAVTRDGQEVAVKVQYPGIGDAITADLANAEVLYGMFAAFALKGLDTRSLVDELRSRMVEELDYRLEARNQQEFVAHYAGHPFVRIPAVLPELSSERVLTSEWVEGDNWSTFAGTASDEAKQRAGEVIWRFAQGSILRLGAFNGDPHPGNYRFHHDGTVTFLDFGLVKRWSPGEWERLAPSLDAIFDRDPVQLVAAMEAVDFLRPGHGLAPQAVFDYVSAPYEPYLTEEFTFTRAFVADALGTIVDLKGPHAAIIEQLNMPPSFVILDRVVWGVSALLGKLGVTRPWRSMLLEYRAGGPPSTDLGRADAQWWATRDRAVDRAG